MPSSFSGLALDCIAMTKWIICRAQFVLLIVHSQDQLFNANGQKFGVSDIFPYNSFIVKVLEISSLLIGKMTHYIIDHLETYMILIG